jgi:hypothetical protein
MRFSAVMRVPGLGFAAYVGSELRIGTLQYRFISAASAGRVNGRVNKR